MSRWSDDDGDDWIFDSAVQMNATCADCGADYSKAAHDPSTWCDGCSDRRDAHASALQLRMATMVFPTTRIPGRREVVGRVLSVPVVVEVALVPVSLNGYNPVVDVALVPVVKQSGQIDEKLIFEHSDIRDLKRMAKAILSADLTQIKEVA